MVDWAALALVVGCPSVASVAAAELAAVVLGVAVATLVEVEAIRVAMLVAEPLTTMVKTKITKVESILAMDPLPLISCKVNLRKNRN